MFGFFYSLYVGLSKFGQLFKTGVERNEGLKNNANYEIGIYTDSRGVQRWIKGNDPVGYYTDLNGDVWYTNSKNFKKICIIWA